MENEHAYYCSCLCLQELCCTIKVLTEEEVNSVKCYDLLSHTAPRMHCLVLSMRLDKLQEHEAWSKDNCTALTLHKSKGSFSLNAVHVSHLLHIISKPHYLHST